MRLPTGQHLWSSVLPCLTFSVLPIMTVAPTHIIYIPFPSTHLFTNHHGGAHDSDIPSFDLFHFKIRQRSHDFRGSIQTQITPSPAQRPQMENDRRTEHSAPEEEVHFHYQSRRGRCTLWTPLFLHTTNHHGGAARSRSSSSLDTPIPTTNLHGYATNTHSSLDTPSLYTLDHYQSPRLHTHPTP